ncbi:MAG: ACT domain-containing protein, partial [Terriglobales bacterium]
VNASGIAAERGIVVHEIKKTKTPGGGAASVLSVLLKTNASERLAKGAVLHGDRPRLLAVDDIDIEAPLAGNLVYLRNKDVPGVIGRVGTILGQHRINIANFSLGRRESGKPPVEAIAVVHVDGAVPSRVLEELKQIEAVTAAKAIRL